MIANVTPAISSYEDTLNTLKYAQRAKTIKTVVSKNMKDATTHAALVIGINHQLDCH